MEALVIQKDEASCAWEILSLFYDPNQGQSVANPFDRWQRGHTGLLPTDLCAHALAIIQGWAIPDEEFSSFKEYADRITTFDQQLRTFVSSFQQQ